MENRKGIINYLLGVDVELFNTYHYVHELRRLLKENQIENLIINSFLFIFQMCVLNYIVIRTLRRLATFIENTMTYSNLTNGPLEGINNKIKLIKRVSFGYRNYDNLRNRIIITSRLFVNNKKRLNNLKLLNLNIWTHQSDLT